MFIPAANQVLTGLNTSIIFKVITLPNRFGFGIALHHSVNKKATL